MKSVLARRLVWLLLILFLVVQTVWHQRTYKHIASQLTELVLSQTTNITSDTVVSPRVTSQSLEELRLVARLPGGRLSNKSRTSHEQKSGFLSLLLASFNAQTNVTSPERRKLDDYSGNRLRSACRALTNIRQAATFAAILEHFTLKKTDPRDTFVNLHRYGYHLDSTICREEPQVVILVHSKFDNFGRRAEIRETWASNRTFKDMSFKTVFLLGQPSMEHVKPAKARRKVLMEATERRIRLEAEAFGDIVMANFTDSYRNLTIKHIMALDWVISHCPRVWYIAKVDDDVLVDPYNIVRYVRLTDRKWADVGKRDRKRAGLSPGEGVQQSEVGQQPVLQREIGQADVKQADVTQADVRSANMTSPADVGRANSNASGLLACKIAQVARVQRETEDKWFVTRSEYPFQVYPSWCLGYGLVMTRDVVHKLLRASRDMRSFWIDDVYVTGLLRSRANLSLTQLPGNMAGDHGGLSKFGRMFLLRKFSKNYTYTTYWNELVAANEGQV